MAAIQQLVRRPARAVADPARTEAARRSSQAGRPAAGILTMHQALGNQAMQRLARSCPVFPSRCPFGGACHACPARAQAKLRISQPGDKYEQEADRLADAVMRTPESHTQEEVIFGQTRGPSLQRQRLECEEEVYRQPLEEEEDEEEQTLQAKEVPGRASEATPDERADIEGVRSGGQPLPESVRAFFEPRFGRDFSGVRVHTDERAAETARAVDARAYTVGRDVVFGAGQYAPGTTEGRRLLAHELTHVVQQAKYARTTMPLMLQRRVFGIRLPTGLRWLKSTEKRMANPVFGSSLNYGRILLSNATGIKGRAFTVYARLPGAIGRLIGGVTIINIGPSAYSNPGSSPRLLIHELTHSWQSQHHPKPAAYMVNSIASQAAAMAAGGSAYCYKPGKWFGLYAAEQIAQQVENGETPIVAHVKSASRGSSDPANIVSLTLPRWEKRGEPGVRC